MMLGQLPSMMPNPLAKGGSDQSDEAIAGLTHAVELPPGEEDDEQLVEGSVRWE